MSQFTFKISLFGIVFFLSTWAQAQTLHRQQFLSPLPEISSQGVQVAFFDADSTLRVSSSGSPSANGPRDYNILPGAAEKIRELNEKGFVVAIVSNQAGIPKYISLQDADSALYNMIQDLKAQGAIVHYFDFAENNDEFRKPGVGMGNRLEENLKTTLSEDVYIDKKSSMMVGDSAYKKTEKRPDGRDGFNFSNSDRLFAEKYGIQFYEPQYFFGWIDYGVELIETKEVLLQLQKKMGLEPANCTKLFRVISN